MRTKFNAASEDLTTYQTGPLADHVAACADLFEQYGYTVEHGRTKLRQLRDFSQWLQRRRIGAGAINEQVVELFRLRRRNNSRYFGDGATLSLLLRHLRDLNVVPHPCPALEESALDRVIREYREHQVNERFLAERTVADYVADIRRFLSDVFTGVTIDFRSLTVNKINEFALKETTRRGRIACQISACALRSFLRFLVMTGRLDRNLAQSVPAVAGWRASDLPHYLESCEVEKLVHSCDLSTDVGKRNYAILLLLARLGLRAGEVSKLDLRDVDWTAGEIRVQGKNGRVDRLPLPEEVGEAIVEYLKCRHSESSSKRMFLHVRAPYLGLAQAHASSISSIVSRALKRAHLNPPHQGAHILRHSLATKMLKEGVSLFQIGQVLRHASIQATEVYAKVDLTALRKLAQPWPGGVS
jgi:site-specific recombinase XerD